MKINDKSIITVIAWSAVAVTLAAATLGGLLVSARFAGGVLAGGALALVNFFWLGTVLRRVLHLSAYDAGRFANLRYLLRFVVTACVLFLLIVRVGVDILGLLIGLSVLVFSISGLALYTMTGKGGCS